MTLQHKLLKDLTESDIQYLIDNKIREDKQWDYKRQQIGKSEGEKKEFLQDICSFANAIGGHMILGVDEGEGVERGLPVKLIGFTINVDEEISRLQNILLNGIEPRIYGLDMRAVELTSQHERAGAVALVIRIPQSISLPHMVKFQGHHTFYSRTSNGKYPLEVNELRNLFGLSESAMRRIRNFRMERLGKILAGELPAPIKSEAKLVLHLVPFSKFSIQNLKDIQPLFPGERYILPMTMCSHHERFNFDGVVTDYQRAIEDKTGISAYTQLFRDGSIEAVWNHPFVNNLEEKRIGSLFMEDIVLDYLKYCTRKMKAISIEPPVYIMLSLLGVSNYKMTAGNDKLTNTFDRDSLVIPEIVLENFDVDISKKMKPALDIIWNSVGLSESMGYDEQGNRKEESCSHLHWQDY